MKEIKQLSNKIDAARGVIKSDLLLKNVRFLDVFSCQWIDGDIAIWGDSVVGVEKGYSAKREIDLKGKSIVPGFIDAHVHIESSLLTPSYFQEAVLKHGTTAAICDPHEIANVQGTKGIQYFLDESAHLDLDLYVMLSSCVPATHLETNGAGTISSKQLLPLMKSNKALGLAEMMNVPGVLFKNSKVLKKLEDFKHYPIDGHCPLLTGKDLSAYAAAGISSCHESSEFTEAKEKLQKGIAVWIREGSVAKDLKELAPLLNTATSIQIGFCTDDRNPLDIAKQGHVDYLIRKAIEYGVPMEAAYRSASLSVARHYGLVRRGAIAPGYLSDLVILNDAKSCDVFNVIKSGQLISDLDPSKHKIIKTKNSVFAKIPEAKDLEGPTGRVKVIGVIAGKIITDHLVMSSNEPGVARLSVLERHGNYQKPANGYVKGFGATFSGAIASSVGHDSHNLIVVGKNSNDMRVALAHLIKSGGGFCVVKNQKIIASLDLPFGGLMSEKSPKEIVHKLEALHKASNSVGCEIEEPFLQLAFLSLPVIPKLKLTDKGLVDVEKFSLVDVRV